MTKFFEEFLRKSEGAYPMLKFNSAQYVQDKDGSGVRSLSVRFIISAFDMRTFDDDKKAAVQGIVAEMFPGITTSVQYVKTYADENVVKNKVMEFFNSTNQMIFRRIREDNLKISVTDADIDVGLYFDTPDFNILKASNVTDELKEMLDLSFNQNIDVVLTENVVDPAEVIDNLSSNLDAVVYKDSGLRLISVNAPEKMYGKGKVAGISQLPNYICDVKGPCESIVLCGKVSNIQQKKYKNKKYDPNDPKSKPENTLVRWIMDDTTGKIECVCFPNENERAAFDYIEDGNMVVVMGRVSTSTYTNALNMTVNTLCRGKIDFDSIVLQQSKPLLDRYMCISPQPYVETNQPKSLFDAPQVENAPVPKYLKDKTFVIFDLETTGLETDKAEIIDIGACKMVDGRITETFQSLIKPSVPIPPRITEITHISDDMVSDAPSIDKVIPDFCRFAEDGALVAHNIGFDYPIISRVAGVYGYRFTNDLVDTLKLSQDYIKETNQHKLEVLTKHFGIEHANAHRALADVIATADVLKIIAERMEKR